MVATSRKTRGGITSVVKAHETGAQWKKYHCKWIETHRDGPAWRKVAYFVRAMLQYVCYLPFTDIVHIHVGLRASVERKLLFAKVARFVPVWKHRKRRIIVHFHPSTEKHLFDPVLGLKIKQLFDCADLLLVLSPLWKRWIEKAYPNSSYSMKVLYNPCPVVEGVIPVMKDREKYVLFAGTLNERKGYDRLLEAFSHVCKKYPDWKLVFAGNGAITQAKSLQKKLGISEERVLYCGWVTGKKKDEIYKRASIYCLPSWGEGFPMGVLDAIAYHIPIITTPVGGITDILSDGKDCLIYDTYDIEKLAGCLDALMGDEHYRMALEEAAVGLIPTFFDRTCICKKLGEIYAELG